MNIVPAQHWNDRAILLNNSEDRAAALLLGMFAAILRCYIVSGVLKQHRAC